MELENRNYGDEKRSRRAQKYKFSTIKNIIKKATGKDLYTRKEEYEFCAEILRRCLEEDITRIHDVEDVLYGVFRKEIPVEFEKVEIIIRNYYNENKDEYEEAQEEPENEDEYEEEEQEEPENEDEYEEEEPEEPENEDEYEEEPEEPEDDEIRKRMEKMGEGITKEDIEFEEFVENFKIMDVDELNVEIFPKGVLDREYNRGDGSEIGDKAYSEELSAANRLEFFKKNLNIDKVYIGEKKYAGAILFTLKDKDIVIVENFWENDQDGNKKETYGYATYFLTEYHMFELLSKSRQEVKEISKKKGYRFGRVEHFEGRYYDDFKKELEDLSMGIDNIKYFVEHLEELEKTKEQEKIFDDFIKAKEERNEEVVIELYPKVKEMIFKDLKISEEVLKQRMLKRKTTGTNPGNGAR